LPTWNNPDRDFEVSRTLNIVGAGHVGRVLGRLFEASASLSVQDVLTRSSASAQDAVEFIGAGRAATDLKAMRAADVWMLAVGDDQIAAIAARLAHSQALGGAIVFHCSGARSSIELAECAHAGAATASVHPIRSFADPARVASDFHGTFCGIEGDALALAGLEAALLAIGAQPVPINAEAKTVYHAASVFASNYLVTVLDAALRAYQGAGIEAQVALRLAEPLARESLANVFRLGPEAALSGPIARFDTATVQRQQDALDAWDGPTGNLYRALVAPTVELARRKP
jgi:predicted short-subunit dehydrogenase-like oxidoreductase (DUF2520 family)